MRRFHVTYPTIALLVIVSASACTSAPAVPIATRPPLAISIATRTPTAVPTATRTPTTVPTATSTQTPIPPPTRTPTAAPTIASGPSRIQVYYCPDCPSAPTEATSAGYTVETGAQQFEDFDPTRFNRSTIVENEWYPLKPGTQLVYEGFTVQADVVIPHRVVFTVTDLTKVINGVRAVVMFDVDYKADQLEEQELTFFAQDIEGNVWQLGELVENYDAARFVGSHVWMVGYVEGARAGIMMKARPWLGMPSYSEGLAPAPIYWSDRGRVYEVGQKTTVPAGSYEDVLVIEEYNQEEPDASQFKYYARGVGVVRVGWKGKDPTQESLQLVEIVHLSPQAMAEVRAQALELEKRAYIYGRTTPAEPQTEVAH